MPVVESEDSLGAGHGGDDVHFAGVVGYGDACCGHFGEVAALVEDLGAFWGYLDGCELKLDDFVCVEWVTEG